MTIDNIAEKLGISKSTVSRVLSGKGRIVPDTKKRVLEFVAEHDFKPNPIAKGLAESKTCNIGVVLLDDGAAR